MIGRDMKLLTIGFCAGWIACNILTFYVVAVIARNRNNPFDVDYKVVS